MGRLIDEDAAALAGPGAAPGIGLIVGHVAPAQHVHRAQDGAAQLPVVDGLLHPHGGAIEAALADGGHSNSRALLCSEA